MAGTGQGAPFAGDKKQGDWLLARAERRMVRWLVPRVPPFLETYHLTLLTLAWSAGILGCSLLARYNLHWLWLVSLCIALQYLTDVLDGAVGRYRNTGLVKWGFYMDHFLDYVFLASIIGGYALLLTQIPWQWFLALMALGGAFMINMFLSFAATNQFRIAFLNVGPTEVRVFFILVNTGLVVFGTRWVEAALPFVTAALALVLAGAVFLTQKGLWQLDMELKREKAEERTASR